jgi:hypothetical protein
MRKTTWFVIMMASLVVSHSARLVAQTPAPAPPFSSDNGPPIPRVRSTDSTIAALVARGSEWSATFQQVIDLIDATDGIVYVEPGRCLRSVHACLALRVHVVRPNRILRILVDPRKPDCDLIASIGHELWHAIEVLREPSIRSDTALFFFFAREGRTSRRVDSAFETTAAVKTGDAVRAELRNRASEHAGRCVATLSTPIPEVAGTHELQVLPMQLKDAGNASTHGRQARTSSSPRRGARFLPYLGSE